MPDLAIPETETVSPPPTLDTSLGGAISSAAAELPKSRGEMLAAQDRLKETSAAAQRALESRARTATTLATTLHEMRPPAPDKYLEGVPELRPPPQAEQVNPWQAVFSPVTALAFFGGKLTRTPITTGLKAAAAAIDAKRDGNFDVYKTAYRDWETSTEYTHKLMKWRLDQYDAALKNHKGNVDQLLGEFNMVANATNDTVMQHTIASGDAKPAIDLYENQRKALDGMISKRAELDSAEKRSEMLLGGQNLRNKYAIPLSRFMAEKPDATSEEISKFLNTLESGAVGSPDRRALNKFLEEHPEANSAEIADYLSTLKQGLVNGVPQKIAADAAGRIKPSIETIDRLDSAVKAVAGNPGAIGLTGAVVDRVGGVVQQIETMFNARGALTKQFGVDEIRDVRSQLENTIGPLIPVITGDTSGRYSDRDRKIAEEGFRALQASTSPEQAMVSLSVIRDVALRGMMNDVRLSGPQGASVLKALNVDPEKLKTQRFGELIGKDGEYEYSKIWLKGSEIWAERADGQVGRLKWR